MGFFKMLECLAKRSPFSVDLRQKYIGRSPSFVIVECRLQKQDSLFRL